MKIGQPGGALRQLRALFEVGTTTGLTDSELLERYTVTRAESAEAAAAAESAFAALVDRHGAMVWGVCRRVLVDTHEAEDAFQATFLILVRKAGSVRVDGSLGRWLYGVAHRVALRARYEAEQRRSAIGGAPPSSSDGPDDEVELWELRAIVGEELDALPAKYRCPVELCHMQGMTHDQAARQLNWPVATVKNRLTKGRLRLRAKLARRGLAPSAVAAGVNNALTCEARAAVPPELVRSTARAATACSTGAFPAAVTDLTRRAMKMTKWEKLKLVAAGAVAAFGLGLTAHGVSQHTPNGRFLTPAPPQSMARPTEEPNESKVRDSRWTRSMVSGATIEVVGVSSVPSGPDTWWRPDGTPLHPAPSDSVEREDRADNFKRKLLVVRLTGIPRGAEHEWSIVEARGASRGPTKRDGKPIPDLSETLATLPADARTCTVRFKVAVGRWNTIQTTGKYAGAGGVQSGTSYIFGDPIATAKGSSLSVTHNLQNQAVRLVAIDEAGNERAGLIRSAVDVTAFRQINVEFDQLLEQIKEFKFQARPYEQVEIPRIALERK
jgi:RNA polymerase sigma factor (sigma-70 family)